MSVHSTHALHRPVCEVTCGRCNGASVSGRVGAIGGGARDDRRVGDGRIAHLNQRAEGNRQCVSLDATPLTHTHTHFLSLALSFSLSFSRSISLTLSPSPSLTLTPSLTLPPSTLPPSYAFSPT
eukprot:Opistho-2@59008